MTHAAENARGNGPATIPERHGTAALARSAAARDDAAPVGAAGAALRGLAALLWRASARGERNRRDLYGGAVGLRIVAFHGTGARSLEHLKAVVEGWRARRPVAAPSEVDDLLAGRWSGGGADRLLVTFDDGLATNHAAAAWLARAGVRAVFFVVPSLVDRTVAEFVRYHAERGVDACAPVPNGDARGLSTAEVRELLSMGHRVGAHNFAHRDLGRLRDAADLRYEIDAALDAVGELTGAPCRDFAVGFGQPQNLSAEAAAHLQQRCPNVYMCHRGLNVAGRTPRFLLRHAPAPGHPLAFTRACLDGSADHRLAGRMREMVRRVGVLPGGVSCAGLEPRSGGGHRA